MIIEGSFNICKVLTFKKLLKSKKATTLVVAFLDRGKCFFIYIASVLLGAKGRKKVIYQLGVKLEFKAFISKFRTIIIKKMLNNDIFKKNIHFFCKYCFFTCL